MTQSAQSRATVDSPLAALRRRWWLALVLCPLGAAIGAAASNLSPEQYTAETRLVVGDGSLSTQAVPGYALGAQELASAYARLLNNTAAGTGDSSVKITSSPIPESNIVRIEAKSESKAAAIKAANDSAAQLIKRVNTAKNGNSPEEVLKDFQAAAAKANAVQIARDAAFTRYQNAVGKNLSNSTQQSLKEKLQTIEDQLSTLNLQRDALAGKYNQLTVNQTTAADLTVQKEASITKSDQVARLQRYSLFGFVLGGLISLLAATFLSRRRVPAAGRPTTRPGAPARRQAATADEPWAQTRSAAPATARPTLDKPASAVPAGARLPERRPEGPGSR